MNVAARLESLAEPGGICISEAVRTAVGNKLPLEYDDMGEQRVKNIERSVHAYRSRLKLGGELPIATGRPRPEFPPRVNRGKWHTAAVGATVVLIVMAAALIWLVPREKGEQADSGGTEDSRSASESLVPGQRDAGTPERGFPERRRDQESTYWQHNKLSFPAKRGKFIRLFCGGWRRDGQVGEQPKSSSDPQVVFQGR